MSNNLNQSEPMLATIKHLEELMIKGGAASQSPNADPPASYKVQAMKIRKEDLILFKDVPDCAYEVAGLISKNKLCNALLTILQEVFADVYGVDIMYSQQLNKWLFKVSFRYLTDEQFKAVCNERNFDYKQAVSSTFDPSKNVGNSVGETLLALVSNQNMSATDISRYASFTLDAKSMLHYYLVSNNPKKKKWIKKENYDISCVTQTSYNGQRYSNIIGEVYLDAETVISSLCAHIDDADKYTFAIEVRSTKADNTDSMLKIKRFSKAFKRKLSSEYGVTFGN